MQNQVYIFAIFILNGFLIGILFDIFRIGRISFKTPDIITYMQDIMFWILAGLSVLFSIFKFNNGELRNYVFLGLAFGIAIYFLVFSKIVIKICVNIINIMKKIVKIVIIIPVKYILKLLRRIILKPVAFVVINLKKITKRLDFTRKIRSFFVKNRKKAVYKKDFT